MKFTEQEEAIIAVFRSTNERGQLKMIQSIMNIYDEIEKEKVDFLIQKTLSDGSKVIPFEAVQFYLDKGI